MRIVAALFAILLLVGLATACGGKDGSAAAPPSFEGTPWILSSGVDVSGWQTAAPSVTFEHGRVEGSGGCNDYSARYTVGGDSLEIAQLVTTQMGCRPPANAVEVEYYARLQKVAGWHTEDAKLVLVAGEGSKDDLLIFDPATPAGAWTATAIRTGQALESPHAGAEITARFGAAGTLAGSGGCNTYSTAYAAGRGAIHIAPPSATGSTCGEPAGAMELEAAYLAALPMATRYRVGGSSLTLLAADGTVVASYSRP